MVKDEELVLEKDLWFPYIFQKSEQTERDEKGGENITKTGPEMGEEFNLGSNPQRALKSKFNPTSVAKSF